MPCSFVRGGGGDEAMLFFFCLAWVVGDERSERVNACMPVVKRAPADGDRAEAKPSHRSPLFVIRAGILCTV